MAANKPTAKPAADVGVAELPTAKSAGTPDAPELPTSIPQPPIDPVTAEE